MTRLPDEVSIQPQGRIYLDNATIINALSLLERPASFDIYKLLDLETFCQAFLFHDEVRTLIGHSFESGIRRHRALYSKLIAARLLKPRTLSAGSVHYRIDGIGTIDDLATKFDVELLTADAMLVFPDGEPWVEPASEANTAWNTLAIGEDTDPSDSYPIYHFPNETVVPAPLDSGDAWGWELRNNRRTGWKHTFAAQTFFYVAHASQSGSAFACSAARVPLVASLVQQASARFRSASRSATDYLREFSAEKVSEIVEFLGDGSAMDPIPLPALAYLLRRQTSLTTFVDDLIAARNEPNCIEFREWTRQLEAAWRSNDLVRMGQCVRRLRETGALLSEPADDVLSGVSFIPSLDAGAASKFSPTVAFLGEVGGALLRVGESRQRLEELLNHPLTAWEVETIDRIEARRRDLFSQRKKNSTDITIGKVEITYGDRFDNIRDSRIFNRVVVRTSDNTRGGAVAAVDDED